MSELIFVPVVDLATSIKRAEAELALARRHGDRVAVARLELILLNMRNLQRPTKTKCYNLKFN